MVQSGDCKKSRIVPLNAIIIVILKQLGDGKQNHCWEHIPRSD